MNYLTYDPSGIHIHKSGEGEHDETVEIITADRLLGLMREVAELWGLIGGKPIPEPEFGYVPGPEDIGNRLCEAYESSLDPCVRLLAEIGRGQWRTGIREYGRPLTKDTPGLPKHAAEDGFDLEVYLTGYLENVATNPHSEGHLVVLRKALEYVQIGLRLALNVAVERGDI